MSWRAQGPAAWAALVLISFRAISILSVLQSPLLTSGSRKGVLCPVSCAQSCRPVQLTCPRHLRWVCPQGLCSVVSMHGSLCSRRHPVLSSVGTATLPSLACYACPPPQFSASGPQLLFCLQGSLLGQSLSPAPPHQRCHTVTCWLLTPPPAYPLLSP